MKKIRTTTVLLLMSLLVMLASCNQPNTNGTNSKYEGNLRINLGEVPNNIFPGKILKNSEQIIANQIYDGLIQYNPNNLSIESSIATDWLIERNETLYTFFLNKNAKFQNDECFVDGIGRQIKAKDFKYSIEQICRNHIQNGNALSKQLRNIKGFSEFEKNALTDPKANIKGIFAYNDTILVFELDKTDKMFIHFLAGTNGLVFPKEAFEKYGYKSTVGSGAFILDGEVDITKPIVLTANKDYYKKNRSNEKLPFLEEINISFITSTQKELQLLKNNQIDVAFSLPQKIVTPFLDENIDLFQSNPPYYVLKEVADYNANVSFHILRSNVNDLFINSQSFFDFSIVYIQKPKTKEVKEVN